MAYYTLFVFYKISWITGIQESELNQQIELLIITEKWRRIVFETILEVTEDLSVMRFPKLLLGILCSESAFFLGHYIAISLNFPGILLLLPLCHAFYQGSNLKILLSPQNFMLKLKDVFKEMNRKIASTEQLVFLSYENKTK